MIPACDDQFHVGHLPCNQVESFNHQLKSFIGSPLSESQNAMNRIAAACEIGKLRPAGENPVRSQVNVIPSVFVIQNLAIAGH